MEPVKEVHVAGDVQVTDKGSPADKPVADKRVDEMEARVKAMETFITALGYSPKK